MITHSIKPIPSRRTFLHWAALSFMLIAGCNPGPPASNGPQDPNAKFKKVVCTTGMVADAVRTLLNDDVEILVLMQAGVDPHLFSPSPKDIANLSSADAVFYNGLHLEAGLASTLENMSKQDKPFVYEMAHGLTVDDGLIDVGGDQVDPHFWNDLELWQVAVGHLAEAISEFDPDHAADYEERSKRYQEKLEGMLLSSRALIETLPDSRRLLISAHDAFEYFGRSLGLEVAAVQGISTNNTEASVRKIEELVERIVEAKIPAIFTESTVNDKAIRAIIDGCAQKGFTVKSGGTLYSDALGPAGSGADSFLGMYESNVNTIVEALSGAGE